MIALQKFSRRLLLVVLVSWFSSGARAAEQDAGNAAIHKFVETYFSSWSKADFPLYRSLFRANASIAVLEEDKWQPWDLAQFLNDQERLQSQQKMEEVPVSIDIKALTSRAAFVEVAWRLKRTPDGPDLMGKDWFTLVKEGADWKILNLTFWFDAPEKSAAPAGPSTQSLAAAKGKIIVSGFEGFAGRSINASSEIAQAIVKEFPQLDITFVQVPVVWGAPKQAIDRLRPKNPVIWIAFGEGTNIFQVETVANNSRGEFRDNQQALPAAKQIDPKGAQQLKLDFPADALSKRLRDLGYDCKISSDAGKYLCEEILYSLLAEKTSPDTKLKHALFIHVPVHDSQVRVRGKEVPLSDDNLRQAARDLFEAIAAVLEVPASK
jgi:pyroglutamyl-peptidase